MPSSLWFIWKHTPNKKKTSNAKSIINFSLFFSISNSSWHILLVSIYVFIGIHAQMLKHVQVSPHRIRADSVSLRSSTSCASSLCGSPEPPSDSLRPSSRASSYCSLSENPPQVSITLHITFIHFSINFCYEIVLTDAKTYYFCVVVVVVADTIDFVLKTWFPSNFAT